MIVLEVTRGLAKHVDDITTAGYELYVPDDYSLVEGLVAETGREKQTPMLSIERNDFTKDDAFYLFLMKNGKAVAGTAACRYDLKGESFEAFIRRTSKAQYQREADPIKRLSKPVTNSFSGTFIYLGELEFHPDERGDLRVLRAFVRSLMGLSYLQWPGFDWMYAFLPDHHMKLAHTYGFRWFSERGIEWGEPAPPGRRSDHWLCGINHDQFVHTWSLVD